MTPLLMWWKIEVCYVEKLAFQDPVMITAEEDAFNHPRFLLLKPDLISDLAMIYIRCAKTYDINVILNLFSLFKGLITVLVKSAR